MRVEGNLASGFTCPRCGSRDKQEIIWLNEHLDARLKCASCEYAWTSKN